METETLDEQAISNMFRQTHEFWIKPELDRRWGNTRIPDGFKIRRCLIRLPIGQPPIVQFNEEVGWVAETRMVEGSTHAPGDSVFLSDIERVKAVAPPEVDGKRVAFVFLYYAGSSYSMVFDFSPNSASEGEPDAADWTFGEHLAAYLQSVFVEYAVNLPQASVDQLKKIGLWPAPALLLNPLASITKLVGEGKEADARALLVKHCTPQFLRDMIDKWRAVRAFGARRDLFTDALKAHEEQRYALSVYALVPHIEGVVTDWLYSRSSTAKPPYRQESKTKQFKDVISAVAGATLAQRKVAESALDFVLAGPVLQTFREWTDAIDDAFPGRHVVGHGKYDQALLTEENSIKVFLLLDTLWNLIQNAEQRQPCAAGVATTKTITV